MTQEEKQLLLKDLCSRLPYHPIVKIYNDSWEGCQFGEFDNNLSYHHVEAFVCDRIEIEPYLRPMSSMTEEEKEEYFNVCDEDIKILSTAMDAPDIIISDKGRTQGYVAYKELEWLYEHHFDFIRKVGDKYTTLTDMGLALKAPDGMYNN